MATIVEKIQDLAYDELLTLGVIEQNADLTEVFKTEVNTPFSMLYKLQKEDKLTPDMKSWLNIMFEKLILTKQSFINQYIRLGGLDEPTVESVVPQELIMLNNDVLPIIEESNVAIKGVKTPKEKPQSVVKKDREIPRRYGKTEILKSVEKQGFKATPIQRAGLKLNDLKNLNVSLMNKFIKDTFLADQILTEEQYVQIGSAITMFERKIVTILKK